MELKNGFRETTVWDEGGNKLEIVPRREGQLHDHEHDNNAETTVYGFRPDGWQADPVGHNKQQKEVDLQWAHQRNLDSFF